MDTAIEAQGVSKSFGQLAVLDSIDLRIERASVFCLLGPNGAGKTTLVRILTTLLPMDSGTATIEGLDVATQPKRIHRLIGVTGQFASVDELLTGVENLVMIGRLHHLGKSEARARAKRLLERFDLTHASNRLVRSYSGGMRRRLDIAASLIADPKVLFLDEPTTGLDPRSRHALWDMIRELTADGLTVLLTTQYLEEADVLADRIAVLDNGTIVNEGSARELKREVGSELLTIALSEPQQLSIALNIARTGQATVDSKAHALTMPIQSPEHLRAVLNRFAEEQIQIDDVALASPTLDDVFFSLTETPSRQEAAT